MFVDLINQRKILLVKLIDLFVEAVPCCMKEFPLLQFYRFRCVSTANLPMFLLQFLDNISGMSFAARDPLTRAFIDLFKPEFFELLAE